MEVNYADAQNILTSANKYLNVPRYTALYTCICRHNIYVLLNVGMQWTLNHSVHLYLCWEICFVCFVQVNIGKDRLIVGSRVHAYRICYVRYVYVARFSQLIALSILSIHDGTPDNILQITNINEHNFTFIWISIYRFCFDFYFRWSKFKPNTRYWHYNTIRIRIVATKKPKRNSKRSR